MVDLIDNKYVRGLFKTLGAGIVTSVLAIHPMEGTLNIPPAKEIKHKSQLEIVIDSESTKTNEDIELSQHPELFCVYEEKENKIKNNADILVPYQRKLSNMSRFRDYIDERDFDKHFITPLIFKL
jgi:hypothetical protein